MLTSILAASLEKCKEPLRNDPVLQELDAKLSNDIMILVNLHHKTKAKVDYSQLNHMEAFPEQYDIYEVLAASDTLVTDYSSVFFDYAACGRKIVLHCPDISEYRASRGFNMDIRDLPFPITVNIDELVHELSTEKAYEDAEFRKTFNAYDSERNTELLLRSMLLGDFS